MGLIRTLVIFGILYYLGKFFFKYLAPIFLTNYIKSKTEQQGQYTNNTNVPKEGTTTIDKKPQQKKTVDDGVGEYVDYEEVE